ncbi:hypothetical protein GCM10010399_68820 [Dactylosporangium fulvum]
MPNRTATDRASSGGSRTWAPDETQSSSIAGELTALGRPDPALAADQFLAHAATRPARAAEVLVQRLVLGHWVDGDAVEGPAGAEGDDARGARGAARTGRARRG